MSRAALKRLFLFISSIIFGIAAIVAIYSFRHNLQDDVNNQSAALLGADLVISGNDTVSAKSKAVFDSMGDRRSRECRFASMVYFLKDSGTTSYQFFSQIKFLVSVLSFVQLIRLRKV